MSGDGRQKKKRTNGHEIQWIETDGALTDLGHGVEFCHKALPGMTIAFADGFVWLKQPGWVRRSESGPVRRSESRPPEGGSFYAF